MRRIDETPSIIERIIGSVIASVFAAGTAMAVPLLLAWKFPFKFFLFVPITKALATPIFYLWISFVAVCALVAGFRYGFFNVLDVFNLIWKTGDSNDRHLRHAADRYRVLIPATVFISYLLILPILK